LNKLRKDGTVVDKAYDLGKTSVTGSFQLLIGVAASTIIMAVQAIFLGRFLTRDEYGLYTIVLVPSTMINLFRDWGVNSAMTRYIASLKVSQRDEEIYDFIVAGLIFEVVSGIALSFLSLFLASFIASAAFHRPESTPYIGILSVSIISGSLLAASQAGFVGFERMGLSSFTLICQAIVKTAVGIALVLLGYSVLGAVIGTTLGFAAAGIAGIATFYVTLLRPLRKELTKTLRTHGVTRISKTLKTMLNYGVPLSIGISLSSILTQIYAFIIIPLTTNGAYADYTVATYFAVLLTFLTIPIATVLFPTFAKLDPQNEHELIKNVFKSSIKYTSMLVAPATMVLMTLSGPIVGTVFGEKYINAPFFLTISVVGTLLAVLGSQSFVGFLSGLGETGTLMKANIITIVVGIPLGVLLIPPLSARSAILGITGLIIATVVSNVPSTLWVIHWIWKHYRTRADFRSSAKILLASAIAAFLAYLPTAFLNAADWIKLIIGLAIFLTVYVLGAPIIGAVSLTDISSLKVISSGMGKVSKIINIPLNAAERVARIKAAHANPPKKQERPEVKD
jgi:O-antigen/teichoic acid export membrane protein